MEHRPGGVGGPGATSALPTEPVVIKKYANRRLYNTATGAYVALVGLRELVQAGVDIVVFDVPTGADITRQILCQIILDAEAQGEILFQDAFLRRLISLHDDDMGLFVPSYLQMALDAFSVQNDGFADRLSLAGGLDAQSASRFRQQMSQNLMVFDRAMQIFGTSRLVAAPAPSPSKAEFAELYARMGEMQGMLDRLITRQAAERG
jgi:polyhydroxyalkanoate synthesis repressor PhaR